MKHKGNYFVYILASESNILYVGVTNDIERRLFEHQSGTASMFTKKYKVHRLVHIETFSNINDAIRREKQIKAWRRTKKIELIKTCNPNLDEMENTI